MFASILESGFQLMMGIGKLHLLKGVGNRTLTSDHLQDLGGRNLES